MNLADLKKKRGRVVGIDCSTLSLAYSVFDDGELMEWGEFHFNGANTFERLADGQEKLRAVKDIFKADYIIMESAVYVQNKKTVILLAYAFGAILSAIIAKGCKVEQITPTEWQSAIGNGPLKNTEKNAIMEQHPGLSKSKYKEMFREYRKQRTADWVNKNYKVSGVSDNVTDAIAIGSVGSR